MSSPLPTSSIKYDQPVELWYGDTLVVSFEEGLKGPAKFSDKYKHIKKAMEVNGIAIPPFARTQYPSLTSDTKVIYLNDAAFGKAFYEIYFKQANFDPTKFVWKPISR